MHRVFSTLSSIQKSTALLVMLYFLLWIVNPSNRMILAGFFVYAIIVSFFFKDIIAGFFVTYLGTLPIHTGKSYQIQLIPPGEYLFSIDRWPNGYEVKLIITPAFVFAAILGVLIARYILSNRNEIEKKICMFDIILGAFVFVGFVANLFGSQEPVLSVVGYILGLHWIMGYAYIRIIKPSLSLPSLFVFLLSAFILTQSVFSVDQYFNKSPLGKTIESQILIEAFGDAVDEIAHGFRPVGTFTHANDLGAFLAFALMIVVSYTVAKRSYWAGIVSLIGFTTVILTMSRSAWIGCAIGLTVIVFRMKQEVIFFFRSMKMNYVLASVFVTIALLLCVFIIVPRVEKSIYTFADTGGGGFVRSQQIKTTIDLIALYPLTGVGLFMSVPQSLQLEPDGVFRDFPASIHNIFLLQAVELGLPYLSLFFLLIGYCMMKLYQARTHYFIVGLLGAFCGAVFIGYYQPIFYSHVAYILFVAALFHVYEYTHTKTNNT